jgi:hypothetical protein
MDFTASSSDLEFIGNRTFPFISDGWKWNLVLDFFWNEFLDFSGKLNWELFSVFSRVSSVFRSIPANLDFCSNLFFFSLGLGKPKFITQNFNIA